MDIKEEWKRETGYTIRNVDTSANGEYIIVGSFDNKVYLFDRQGTLLWSYLTGDTVRDVAISFDGKYMAAGSYDHHVYYFNTKGELLWKFRTGDPVRDISISAGGEYLVVGSNDNHVYFLDQQGDLLWKYRTKGSVVAVALSMKGEYVSIGSTDRSVYFFNRKGDLLWSFETGSSIQDVEMTTRGKYIAAGSFDKYLYFFDRTGNLLWKRKGVSPVRKVAISPLGDSIAAGGEGEVILYDQNGTRLWQYTFGEHEIRGLEISSQGGSIICGSRDNELLYFERNGRLLWRYRTPQWVETVAVGSRGRFITAGLRNGVLYLFDSIDFFKDYLEEARQSIVRMENFGTDATKARALFEKATNEFGDENYMKSLALTIRVRSLAENTVRRIRPVFSYSVAAESPLRYATWTPIHFNITNTGKADAQDIMIKFLGPVRLRGEKRIEVLKADEVKNLRMDLKPMSPGVHSIEMEISYFDFGGMQYSESDKKMIQVFEGSSPTSGIVEEGKQQRTMLFRKIIEGATKGIATIRSDPKCPNCNRDIFADWIVCPYCATPLK